MSFGSSDAPARGPAVATAITTVPNPVGLSTEAISRPSPKTPSSAARLIW
ncbi:hypothetical protein SCALM49S_00881 [Streptomyces californicus]